MERKKVKCFITDQLPVVSRWRKDSNIFLCKCLMQIQTINMFFLDSLAHISRCLSSTFYSLSSENLTAKRSFQILLLLLFLFPSESISFFFFFFSWIMQNALKATVYNFYLPVLGCNIVLQRYITVDKQTHSKTITR